MMQQNTQQQLTALFTQAIDSLKHAGDIASDIEPKIILSRPKDNAHGDFSCNVAMMIAKQAGLAPTQMAALIIEHLPKNELIGKTQVAGAGFINVFLNTTAKFAVLDRIFEQKNAFGLSNIHQGKKVLVEFVSANPTSSLHVGHGRGAAVGETIANLLSATGHLVHREYYVNDAGRQMDILAVSTFIRYLELIGEPIVFPVNGYQGDYVTDIANQIVAQYGDGYRVAWTAISDNVPADACQNPSNPNDDTGDKPDGDKEAHIDGLIANAKRLLGDGYAVFHHTALSVILDDIKDDLAQFGVVFDQWFSEKCVAQQTQDTLAILDKNGFLYTKDGNVWFKSTQFGDEKDRVVKRANGQMTYFAADIAYHKNKLDRGFDTIINIWGADHHGYIARMRGALSALGYDEKRLEVILVQFVALYRGDQKIAMSSRTGQFITLRELRQEVGDDAARFYYVARTPNIHMDFDLELAKSQSRDNPVYYIQYAHARICRVFEKLHALGYAFDRSAANLAALNGIQEDELIKLLSAYPDIVLKSSNNREVHLLSNYLKDLSAVFHGWYNDTRLLSVSLNDKTPTDDELATMQARLYLAQAVRQVIQNGLTLLGLSAPTAM